MGNEEGQRGMDRDEGERERNRGDEKGKENILQIEVLKRNTYPILGAKSKPIFLL